MIRFFRVIGAIIVVWFTASFCFFFWASSPTLAVSEYAKIHTFTCKVSPKLDSTYSIITYNIGYLSGMSNNLPVAPSKEFYEKNLQKVLAETKAIDPDLIALQEIDFDAARSFHVQQQDQIAALGYNYVAEAVNWDETYLPFPYWPPTMHYGQVVSGQSVLSKFPILSQDRVVLSRVADAPFYRDALYIDRLAQVVIVEILGKEVVLINVHLEAFDKTTRVQQLKEVVSLFQYYAATNPTILLGDFNSDPQYISPAIEQLFDLEGVGNAAFTKDNYELTFNSDQPFERLDYIFYTTKSIGYVSGEVLTQYGTASDHLPLLMKFTLK